MALQLVGTATSGASGDYWRITYCAMDAANKQIGVAIALYVSQACRQNKNDPLSVKQYQFEYDPFVSDTNAIKVAYEMLKALPEYANAVDA